MSADIFEQFPVIDLDDIVMRQLTLADIPRFYEYLSHPQVNKFICDDDIPKDLKQAEHELLYWADLFKHRRSIYWAIAKKKNDQLIGTCGFNVWSKSHRRCEVSYDLDRKEWGKGIMSRVLRATCDFAMIRMNVTRIQATVAYDNEASIKLLERTGFKPEGSLRNYGILHGVSKDFFMYSLLSSDLTF